MLWHALLHCSNETCWMEFPVIDGVPVIVQDPPGFLTNAPITSRPRAMIVPTDDAAGAAVQSAKWLPA